MDEARDEGGGAHSEQGGRLRFFRPRPDVLLFMAAILLPAVLFALSAWTGYRDTLRTAEARVERTARVLEEHVNKVFESHRLVIQQVRERLRYVDWAREDDRAELHRLLAELQDDLDQVTTIVVVDTRGRMLASGRTYPADPGVSFADRDWFAALIADKTGSFVSRAYLGRLSHQPVFNLAVALRDRTGAFAGAIAVSIDRNYFEKFYRDVEPEFDHAVTLVRRDGEILARFPSTSLTHLPDNSRFLKEIERAPASSYIGVSHIDNVARVFAYRKIGSYPIYVRFGIGTDAVLAPWRRSLVDYGLVALLSSFALAVASWLAVRQTARERLAKRRWRETAAALEIEVAERERIDEQMRQMQKMEAIGQLTGGIAHDFNNLLTAVMGNLELAGRHVADPKVSRLMANAIDGAQRAANLTHRLLAFSRRQPLQPTRIDLDELVAGMADLLRITVGESVALKIERTADLWPVEIDTSQLENVVLNLAVNARDAMPDGGTLMVATANEWVGPDFHLVRRGELKVGAYATISVRDTGQGMPEDVMSRAFEPFFTTKPIGKGTGLGLSQVYGFARQSGGHVVIRSAAGQGTTIRLFLPRMAEAGFGGALLPVAGQTAEGPKGRGETILMVEDETIVRGFGAAALRAAGYRVLEAGDGPEALTLLGVHPEIGLLFTDVVLKGPLDGHALARIMRRRRHDLPVLYTTGYARDANGRGKGSDRGLTLLRKPYTVADLEARVRAVLDAEAIPEKIAV